MTTDGHPPFRAEHVGSFVRPERLLQAARAHRAGDLDAEPYREIQDDCIREVVAWQDDIGMPSVTDGEFRRRSWSAGVIDALDGFGLRDEGALKFRTESGELGVAAMPSGDEAGLAGRIVGGAFSEQLSGDTGALLAIQTEASRGHLELLGELIAAAEPTS